MQQRYLLQSLRMEPSDVQSYVYCCNTDSEHKALDSKAMEVAHSNSSIRYLISLLYTTYNTRKSKPYIQINDLIDRITNRIIVRFINKHILLIFAPEEKFSEYYSPNKHCCCCCCQKLRLLWPINSFKRPYSRHHHY